MDVKVICTDDNYYFRLGISGVIEAAFLCTANVEFLSNYDSKNIQQADFILVHVSQWRLFMCQPAYRHRKPGSVLLVFVDRTDSISSEQLPVCYQSLTLIDPTENVSKIRDKIANAWLTAQKKTSTFMPSDCVRCKFSRISLVQLQVISFIKKGSSVRQIAKSLGLSIKTIYAHKYNVMKKFNIKSDCDFCFFLNDLSLIELYKGVVNDNES
ncbi:helix-turn-helix transcriptional regulator [Erwinia sp. P7711]|uniref:helix-turn-helix domain-containing protein n=1 Tax=Erwinia sp. P7711 TaxID=3141451 RepID=UPI0031880C1E